jgi:hypothetical protein
MTKKSTFDRRSQVRHSQQEIELAQFLAQKWGLDYDFSTVVRAALRLQAEQEGYKPPETVKQLLSTGLNKVTKRFLG